MAVEVDGEIRGTALGLIGELAETTENVKWVEDDDLHFTLKFLGEVDLREIHNVVRTIRQAVKDVESFTFAVGGCGAFPKSENPKTIWLGAGDGSEKLVELQGKVDAAMEKLGYRPEPRRFIPHLTLGRVRGQSPDVAALAEAIQARSDLPAGVQHVHEVVLFSSELTRNGPIYEVLGRAALDG